MIRTQDSLFYQLVQVFAITIVITMFIIIFMNPNAKFQDNSGTLAQAGQEALIRDCPGHSGMVGNYVFHFHFLHEIIFRLHVVYMNDVSAQLLIQKRSKTGYTTGPDPPIWK